LPYYLLPGKKGRKIAAIESFAEFEIEGFFVLAVAVATAKK
jgi:hypothetical protein